MKFIDLGRQYAALREDIELRMRRVLEHGQYIMGPEVRELEERLAAWTGAAHCITVASGTEALLIALMALDLKPGDEVITTPFTFVATVETIVLAGAKPVLVDIDPLTCNIDAGAIEAAITPRTRAIMPVALYGQPADMDEINAVTAKSRIAVIEDAAQSFGATYRGRASCGLSTIGCTSFYPSKPLGCYGDGGALFTDDPALAKAMRQIRVHGEESRYRHVRVGVGGRMDTLQCAVVLAKLARFEWELAQRESVALRYAELLGPLEPAIGLLPVKPDRTSAWAQFTIRGARRDALQAALRASGIPTAVHYPIALHQQPAYKAMFAGARFAHSEQAAREVISLPMHADLDEANQRRVAAAVAEAVAAAGVE